MVPEATDTRLCWLWGHIARIADSTVAVLRKQRSLTIPQIVNKNYFTINV
jgi:hypothetical protein